MIKIFSSSFCSGFIMSICILLSVGGQHRFPSWQKCLKLPLSPASTFDGQHVLCLWPEVHADVPACPLFHSVSILQLLFWKGQPSAGFNKASLRTFRKPLDLQFDRKMSSATFTLHGFTECLWTKAVFHRPVLFPQMDEIYLRSFSKSLKGHTPDWLQRRCRRTISGFNCDSIHPVKIPWNHSCLFVLADTELKCPNRFKPPE